MQKTLRERFDARWLLDPATGCWLWIAGKDAYGYGQFHGGRGLTSRAHRWSWMLYRGEIPSGVFIDHMCRVKHCVNPDHLRLATPAQNTLENSVGITAQNKIKTHCSRGHEYAGRNLAIKIEKGKPRRVCRRCSCIHTKRYEDRCRAVLARLAASHP